MPPTAVMPAADALTLDDRCDRCGGAAYARASLPASPSLPRGGMLLLCGHHLNAHRSGLLAAGAHIDDHTDLLHARPSG